MLDRICRLVYYDDRSTLELEVYAEDKAGNYGYAVNYFEVDTVAPKFVSGIELWPNNNLKRGTWYTVKVTTGVNDGANNLEAPKTWSFKTKG